MLALAKLKLFSANADNISFADRNVFEGKITERRAADSSERAFPLVSSTTALRIPRPSAVKTLPLICAKAAVVPNGAGVKKPFRIRIEPLLIFVPAMVCPIVVSAL